MRCQGPLFPGPCAPEGHPVLWGGTLGSPLVPCTSLGIGKEHGEGLHPSALPACGVVTVLTPRDAACGPAGDAPFCILQ